MGECGIVVEIGADVLSWAPWVKPYHEVEEREGGYQIGDPLLLMLSLKVAP